MSQFITCHETSSRRPRRIPVREVAKVEPQGEAWAIFSPTTITLRSGERVEVIEPPGTVRDMTRRGSAPTGA
ncbi:MAG: hypothetical protein OXG04_27790 [Acidobacteria bacterium]|nr:hypothetical protein [Acidobacteriota bacterium]